MNHMVLENCQVIISYTFLTESSDGTKTVSLVNFAPSVNSVNKVSRKVAVKEQSVAWRTRERGWGRKREELNEGGGYVFWSEVVETVTLLIEKWWEEREEVVMVREEFGRRVGREVETERNEVIKREFWRGGIGGGRDGGCRDDGRQGSEGTNI